MCGDLGRVWRVEIEICVGVIFLIWSEIFTKKQIDSQIKSKNGEFLSLSLGEAPKFSRSFAK
jgi:hypothetical protein